MLNMRNCLIFPILCLAMSGSLFGNPSFVTNRFDTGSEGWQPWTTSDVNGLSPGNPYLNIAADGSGVFGKMITFNPNPEWTGNYISAGVTGIRMEIANMSDSDDVFLRVALGNRASPQQSGGTWWISKTAAFIPLQMDWTSVFLPVSESDMIVVGNIMGESDNESFADTLSNIQNIRILSAAVPLGAIGDEFVGDVGIDNVALVPEPSTVALIGFGSSVLALGRKRANQRIARSARTGKRHNVYRQLDALQD
jgi:hypothetical protein